MLLYYLRDAFFEESFLVVIWTCPIHCAARVPQSTIFVFLQLPNYASLPYYAAHIVHRPYQVLISI